MAHGVVVLDGDFAVRFANERAMRMVPGIAAGAPLPDLIDANGIGIHQDELPWSIALHHSTHGPVLVGVPRGAGVQWVTSWCARFPTETGSAWLVWTFQEHQGPVRPAFDHSTPDRFEALFRSNMLGMFVGTMDGLIRDANDAFLGMFGFTRADLPLDWRRMTDGSSAIADAIAWEQIAETGTAALYEKLFIRPDGARIPVLVGGAMLDQPTGTVLALTVDLTERRKAEGEIRQINVDLERVVAGRTAELQEVVTELEAFNYSVSHDLRSPLRSVNGFASILLADYHAVLDDEGRDLLHRIIAASSRMAGLIDGLLKLSRVTKAPLNAEPVDLSEMADEIVEELRIGTGRAVTIDIEPGLRTMGDAALLRIVLENLLGNAWKFTQKKSNPMIALTSVLQEGKRVMCVGDNGVGFDMADGGRLFKPFERLHSEREFQGTGIGLATVRRILRRHGARIWFDSAKEQGARFYFDLPILQA